MKINFVFLFKRSCFKLLLSVLRCHVFLHQVELRKGEDEDGGNGWHNMSVIMMSLSQYVSCCDRALLSGKIGRTSTPTRFFIWSMPCPVQFWSWGLKSFPASVYEIRVRAVWSGYGGGYNSTAILLVMESSFWSNIVASCLESPFLRQATGG